MLESVAETLRGLITWQLIDRCWRGHKGQMRCLLEDPGLSEIAVRARRFKMTRGHHTTHVQRYEFDVIARHKRMPTAFDRYKKCGNIASTMQGD